MSPRLSHAARFALPTFVAVLVAALCFEVWKAFFRGEVPPDAAPTGAVVVQMVTWAAIATVMLVVVFLLRLSDVIARPPSWGFAWIEAAWVAVATVLAMHALEAGRVGTAVGIAGAATLLWIAIHRRIPGWPGASPDTRTDERAGRAEQDLR